MKKVLLLLLSLAASRSFAQFELEHTYSQGVPVRIELEFSGEKYGVHDKANQRMDLYNPDHTLWKSIDTPAPAGAYFIGFPQVSDALVNSDANVELIYSYQQSSSPPVSKVISENGAVLLAVPNCNQLYLNQKPGLAPKRFGYASGNNVYSLPGLALEHA